MHSDVGTGKACTCYGIKQPAPFAGENRYCGEHQNSNISKGSSKHPLNVKLRVHFTLSAAGIFKILQDRECPSLPGNAGIIKDSDSVMLTIERWKIDSNYFYSILFLATHGGTQKPVKHFEGR